MDEVRNLLPEREQGLFDDIVCQRVLGASRHIQMIGEMFLALADQAETAHETSETLDGRLREVAGYFKRTRGEASRAITNAINLMLRQMGDLAESSLKDAAERVRRSVEYYASQSEQDIRKLVGYAVEVAGCMDSIMVFDYSSTVNAFLRNLGKARPGLEVYIPESRTINGGYAFVPTALEAGLKVHFIPDAAIMYFLRGCDGAFFGAETLYADGTAFNTTGSDIVGLVCKTFHVPLYVLTPMVKLDIRPVHGYRRELVVNDLKERMRSAGFACEESVQVDFNCPELLPVEAEHITGIITEYGVIPTGAVYPLAVDYDKNLNLGDGEHE